MRFLAPTPLGFCKRFAFIHGNRHSPARVGPCLWSC
jgi:hypothetical protein